MRAAIGFFIVIVSLVPAQAFEWRTFGGEGGQQFAPFDQITPENVKDLEVAWRYHTGDVLEGKTAFELTPILVEDTLYICTPFNRVVALDPATGLEKWVFDPEIDTSGNFGNQLMCRGVSYWESTDEGPCAKRILTATNQSELIALDAETGALCTDFGDQGRVDLLAAVGVVKWHGEYHITSPPAIIGDIAVVGSAISDNARIDAPSGVVRGFDVRTGAQVWAWDLAPPDFDYETGLVSDEGFAIGTPNVWGPMAVDEPRDLVFMPTGNPSPDYYRPEDKAMDFYGSSIVALRGSTGEVVWHFQTTHRDHWDFDNGAQPSFVDLMVGGESVPAVVQGTKAGLLFVLNRETGEPIFPVEERPVPQGGPPGVDLSPTQPFPTGIASVARDTLSPDDAFGFTFYDGGQCRNAIEELRFEGTYTPISEAWTLMMPGNAGGINWGGLAIDPGQKILVVNSQDLAFKARLIPREVIEGSDISAASLPASDLAAMRGTPYYMQRSPVISSFGVPCNAPPWGTLTAIDLTTGEKLWRSTLGTTRDLLPAWLPISLKLGSPSFGGPLVTGGGLVFIGAAMDNYLRAFDLATGKEIWKERVPAGPQAIPMSYQLTDETGSARQYIAIAVGGHSTAGTKLGDELIVYTLK